MLKSVIILVKSYLATFLDIWRFFSGHTEYDGTKLPIPREWLLSNEQCNELLFSFNYLSSFQLTTTRTNLKEINRKNYTNQNLFNTEIFLYLEENPFLSVIYITFVSRSILAGDINSMNLLI